MAMVGYGFTRCDIPAGEGADSALFGQFLRAILGKLGDFQLADTVRRI